MKNLTTFLFTHTTGDDQLNYFSGEFSSGVYEYGNSELLNVDEGNYRVIDGQLYQIKPDLPPILMDCK